MMREGKRDNQHLDLCLLFPASCRRENVEGVGGKLRAGKSREEGGIAGGKRGEKIGSSTGRLGISGRKNSANPKGGTRRKLRVNTMGGGGPRKSKTEFGGRTMAEKGKERKKK